MAQSADVESATRALPDLRRRAHESWPQIPLASWRDTCQTLHLYTQIIGKIRLALTPKENQWWNVPLYATARGLTTSAMPYGDRTFEIDFDFIDHELLVKDSDGHQRALSLVPRTVANFYHEVFAVLDALGIRPTIRPMPVEIPETTLLIEDQHHSAYDAEHAYRFWQALRSIAPVFELFRAGYRGKCSPVHFFWGSFDLAVSRFSGRRAPPRTKTSIIERDAYDEEVFSLGFWPGEAWEADRARALDACFYAYMAPAPAGFQKTCVPTSATYNDRLREFILPYEDVRRASDPARAILEFAQATYDAGASLAGWDRTALAYP